MALDTETLTPKEEASLRQQGLKEQIRNDIHNARSLASEIKNWKNEENPATKLIRLKRIERIAEQVEKDMNRICLSLDYFDCVEIKQKTST